MVARIRSWQLVVAVAVIAAFAPASAQAVWSGPHDLSPRTGNARLARAVVDPAGTVHVLWQRGGVEAVAHEPGGPWSEPVSIADPGSQVGGFQHAIDAAGTQTAIWFQWNGGRQSIRTATRPRGGAWSAPHALAESDLQPQIFLSPALAVAADGTVTAMWTDSSIVRSAVRAPDGTWSRAVTVNDALDIAVSPQVVVDPAGNATAVWYQRLNGPYVIYGATRPAGGAWTSPQLLTRNSPTAPSLAVAPDGTATAAWKAVDGSGNVIESSSHKPGLGWEQTTVAATGVSNSPPYVAVDRDGNAAIVYFRDVAGTYAVHLVERPAGGTWTAPAMLSAPGRDAVEPRVAFDSEGRAVAVWRRKNDFNHIVQSVSRPRGGSWSEAANLSAPDTVPRELSDLAVTFDADGDALVTWYRTDGTTFRIQYAVDDTHAPRLDDLVAPATAKAGVAAAFSVAPWDAWSAMTTRWEFGDGATATGTSVEHVYAEAGERTVTVTATDALGLATTRTAVVTVSARDPPVVDPPTREPPVVDPPARDPPVQNPPAQHPPATDPPRQQPAPPRPSTPPAARPVLCRVPQLTGLTLAHAKRRLKAAHCALGRVRYVNGRRNAGKVVRSSHRRGAAVAKGTRIDVTVVRRRAAVPQRRRAAVQSALRVQVPVEKPTS
ncbi:PKD domain-containing protein [Conexibacter woesei]|uniref:PKD domain containing protein n=1 Tax=Conexibacter woesei (strain DSM 14684 / CCUG 47730 / CIP 108061 / JCM 11494 / NBRC 100937 / ID131577) TaxID=469383 RepID=D3F790_CONWI|nr:PKD domain-containing protein [Conexibacter woesei]ADB48861.1 PKD domain containing protein [Conexibacter woesei DSM 14684]